MKACISKYYGDKRIFDNFQIQFNKGEIVCVLGNSGVGKTTLLQILARQTSFEGALTDVPESIGYAYQEPRLLPALTVEDNLRYVGGTDEEITRFLQMVQLYDKKNCKAAALSGGEKSRVSLCRAFLGDKKLVLLDEPFSSLDIPLRRKLYGVVYSLWKEKKPTVVLVTHDIEDAWALGQRIVVVGENRVALDTPIDVDIVRPYTCVGSERLKQTIIDALTDGQTDKE